MKKILLLLLFPVLVGANPIDINCKELVIWGAPIIENDLNTQYLCKTDYAINLNYKTKVANYVVERVTSEHLKKNVLRKNNFHEDKEVPIEYRVVLQDYIGGLYDRGHLSPAGNYTYNAKSMDESFLLSNMIPQNKNNNRGVWNTLEQHVRDVALKSDVYVITGGVFNTEYKKIGNNVGVPDYIYKIVIRPKDNMMVAYLIPNVATKVMDLKQYIVSILKLEKLTGINFSPLIPVKLKLKEAVSQKYF